MICQTKLQTRLVKMFFVNLVIILLASTSFAYTTPGTGVIWTGDDLVTNSEGAVTWDEINSRYLFNEQIIVSATDQLTINYSIHSLFDDEDDIEVMGDLYVMPLDSTVTDSILITGDYEADGPGGIRVVEGGYLYLEQAVMIGLVGGHDQAIRNFEGTSDVFGCRFADWERYALNISGGAEGSVENCILHDNQQWTINISTGSTFTINNCTLLNNNLASPTSAKNPISIGAQGANTVYVNDCHITGQEGNVHGGISVWNVDGAASYLEVRNTTIENASFGIIVNGDNNTALITDCILHNNNVNPNAMVSGSGITIQYGAEATIARCDITGNHWGITTYSGNSTANLGDFDAEDPDEQGANFIYENGNGGNTYNFYNNTTFPQLAQNNWWGSDDPEIVEQGIFHTIDDESLGLVTFLPLYAPSAPIINAYSPDELELVVHENETIVFSFEAVHPAFIDMDFKIYHDDSMVSDTNFASITFTEDVIQEVTGVVSDQFGMEDSITWLINGFNHAPEIIAYDPPDLEVQIYLQEDFTFSVTAEDPDEDELEYRWYIDNVQQFIGQEMTIYPIIENTYEVKCIVRDPYLAADSVAWTVTNVNAIGETELLPTEFGLNTYPNPFNPSLTLNYDIPKVTELSIRVYSIDGREVANLYNGLANAGNFNMTWSASNLSSGTYLVQMKAGEFSTTRRVLLLK